MIDHETIAFIVSGLAIISLVLAIASFLILIIKPKPVLITKNANSEPIKHNYSEFFEVREFNGNLYLKEKRSGIWLKETALTEREKKSAQGLPVKKVSKKPI